MTAPIDLESLRGHTPGPWLIPSMIGSMGAVAHASGYVCFTAMPRKADEARQSGETWLDMRNRTQHDRDAIAVEESTNARLIAAAPALLAELTARRARDAEVAFLAEMAQLVHDECDAHNDWAIDAKRSLRIALLPFHRNGAKP